MVTLPQPLLCTKTLVGLPLTKILYDKEETHSRTSLVKIWFQEIPTNTIMCFRHVNLSGSKARLTLVMFTKIIQQFLSQNNVIRDGLPSKNACWKGEIKWPMRGFKALSLSLTIWKLLCKH